MPALLVLLTSCGWKPRGFGDVRYPGEKPLVRYGDGGSVYRMFVRIETGGVLTEDPTVLIVRVEERASGALLSVRFGWWDGDGSRRYRWAPAEERPMTLAEWKEFQRLLDSAGFWSMPPEVDGPIVLRADVCVFAGVADRKLHEVERDAFTATAEFFSLCEFVTTQAGIEHRFWLAEE